MFTHSAPLDSSFSMHDCRATGLRIEKDALIFTFEDGVWACAGSAVNPCEKTIRTCRAEVRLDGFTAEETELAYFRELRFFGWKAAELRKHLTLEALPSRAFSASAYAYPHRSAGLSFQASRS